MLDHCVPYKVRQMPFRYKIAYRRWNHRRLIHVPVTKGLRLLRNNPLIHELERLNLKVNRACLLKEAFREFGEYRYPGWAKRYLDRLFWWTTHSRLEPIRELTWLVHLH